jgi:hypothetical protein
MGDVNGRSLKTRLPSFFKSRLVINLTLVLFSILFTVGVIELLTGGLLTRKVTEFHNRIVSYHKQLIQSPWPLGTYRYNKTIGYELAPSFSGIYGRKGMYFKTHRLGYRVAQSDDIESFQPGGILAVGCSFTFGYPVEGEETFSYLTGKGIDLPVYNFGVCSYSYASVLLQLEDLKKKGVLDKLKPTITILGAGNWLINRSKKPFVPAVLFRLGYAYIGLQRDQLKIIQPPEYYSIKHLYYLVDVYFRGNSRKVDLTFGRYLRLLWFSRRIIAAERARKNFVKAKVSTHQLYHFVLSGIKERMSKYNSKLVVLWMPRIANKIEPGLAAAVKGFKNVILVDGLEALKENNVEPKHYYNRHPLKKAHAAYAQALIERISKNMKEKSNFKDNHAKPGNL